MTIWNITDVGRVSTDTPQHGIRLQGVGYDLGMDDEETVMLAESLIAAVRERGNLNVRVVVTGDVAVLR